MKKPTIRISLSTLLAACALGLGLSGCASSVSDPPADNGGAVAVEAAPEQPAAQPAAEPAAAPAPVVEAPAPVVDEAALRAEKIKSMLARANAKFDAGDLSDARASVSEVLELDAHNAEAQAINSKINALLTAKPNPNAAPGESGETMATLGEYLVEADKLYKAAQSAEAAADWAEAERKYQRLQQLIQYSPFRAEIRDRYEALALAGLKNAELNRTRAREQESEESKKQADRQKELQQLANDQRRREEIFELWRKALYNLELKRYATARGLVDQILNLDRNFRQAEQLRDDIESQRLENLRADVFERRILGYRTALLELRMASVPETEIVTYPHGRLAELIRQRKDNLPDSVRPDPRAVAVQRALEATEINDIRASETARKLGDLVREIADKAGVSILVEDLIKTTELPNLELSKLSCAAALDIICDTYKFRRVFAHGVMQIIAEASQTRPEFVTRVHDVRDITFQVEHFTAPTLNLRDDDPSRNTQAVLPPVTPTPTADELLDFVKLAIGQDASGAEIIGDNQMIQYGGQLVVTQTLEVQGKIRDFLKELRRVAGLLVAMEARFITIQDDFLSDFGIDFRGLGGPSSVPNQANLILEDINSNSEDNAGGAYDNGNLGVPTANPSSGIFFNNANPAGPVNFNRDIRGRFENIFDNALGSRLTNIGGLAMQVAIFRNLTQINAVIQAVQKQGRGRTLIAPRLSAYDTQRSNLAIINQVPYIRDFEPQTAASSTIANPVLDTILDGIVLEVVPTISNDRRFITIEVQPTVAELLLPIPTFVTTLGPTSAVTIQIPELRIQSAKTTVRVPDGGAVVIGGLKSMRDIDVESGTPILMDLPLIGTLFRRKGRSIEQSNLVIVIKAHVVDLNDEELRQPGWG